MTSRLQMDISKAHCRTFLAEEEIDQYAILKQGTDKENQVLLATDDNDRFVGVAVSGNAINQPVTVCEHGGYIPLLCDLAITDLNMPLYIDASAPQRVTSTLSASAGTYYRVGYSKSITAAAAEYVLVYIDPAVVVVS